MTSVIRAAASRAAWRLISIRLPATARVPNKTTMSIVLIIPYGLDKGADGLRPACTERPQSARETPFVALLMMPESAEGRRGCQAPLTRFSGLWLALRKSLAASIVVSADRTRSGSLETQIHSLLFHRRPAWSKPRSTWVQEHFRFLPESNLLPKPATKPPSLGRLAR